MKSLFNRFIGKRTWILLVLAVTSQTMVSCGGRDDGNAVQIQLKTMETKPVTRVKERDRQTERPDVLDVEGWTEIEYSDGDGERSVTEDIGFAYIAEWDGVKINWVSSDESVITNEGKVTRQQEDKNITMTAHILHNGKKYRESFTLTVKRKNTIDGNTLEDYTLEQIDRMNKGDEYYDVCMNDFGYVEDIYGTYSDIKVDSWDMALTSLYNIKSVMGIYNPFEELQVMESYVNEFGYVFKFDQMYKGVRVIDCGVTVSADKNGTVDYIGSSYFPISKDIDINPQITIKEAGEKAERAGYGEFILGGEESEDGKLYIFNDNGTGRLVWYVYCTKDELWDSYDVLVDAKTGEIVYAEEAFISCW